jgi:hypothetical protein
MHYTEAILVAFQVGRKEMKVTDYMIMKWSKAARLVIFGIIFFYFMDPVNTDIKDFFSEIEARLSGDGGAGGGVGGLFDGLSGLIYAIYFIIALWCFVGAALNILSSFREQKMTMDDLGAKLDAIEKRLQPEDIPQAPMQQPDIPQEPMIIQQESVAIEEEPSDSPAPAPPTDTPPPP